MNSRYEEAEAALEEGLALDQAGDAHYLRTVMANMMLVDGRYGEALERFSAYLPDPDAYRLMGEALETRDPTLLDGVTGTPRGLQHTFVLLGELGRAMDVVEEMVFAMPFRVQYDLWDPVLAPLRDLPRFRDTILPRLNLEGAQAKYASPSSR